jgi:hypothetical protein
MHTNDQLDEALAVDTESMAGAISATAYPPAAVCHQASGVEDHSGPGPAQMHLLLLLAPRVCVEKPWASREPCGHGSPA